jgi:prepilin-type N-terminal cleavage/methylation domain-containing protein
MKNKKGFTLIELIIVLAVTTLLLGTVITILLQSIDFYKTDETKSLNQASLNLVSTRLDVSLRKATNVYNDSDGCHIVYTTSEDVFNLSSNSFTVNGAVLTDRIADFTCTNDSDVITVFVRTINDSKSSSLTFNTSIVIRKGE